MPQEGSNQYAIAKKERDAIAANKDKAPADPGVKGLPYGSKAIINHVPQARGTYDRSIIDPDDRDWSKGDKSGESKT